MKPSDYIKGHGLPSLAHVAREANVSERTLFNWYRNRFKLFEIIVAGCVTREKAAKPGVFDSTLTKVTMNGDVVYQREEREE